MSQFSNCAFIFLIICLASASATEPKAINDLTNFFLETFFQPNYLTELEDNIGSDSFKDFNSFVSSFDYYTSEWVFYFFGILFGAFIGIAILIVILVFGIRAIYTRCFGNCSTKAKDYEHKQSKYKEHVCWTILLISIACIFLGTICIFINANLTHENIKLESDVDNSWDDIQHGFIGIDNYFNVTLQTVKTQVYEPFVNYSTQLIDAMYDIPQDLNDYFVICKASHFDEDINYPKLSTSNLEETLLNN